MPLQLLCRKIGNTQIFVDSGECIPVTVLSASSNTVVQKKTEDKDGYSAVQLSFGERKATGRPDGAPEAKKRKTERVVEFHEGGTTKSTDEVLLHFQIFDFVFS